jgi:AGCS family alanine or glycine:cation symporter
VIINNILLSITTILLLGGGLYFSFKMCFPQFMLKRLYKGFNKNNNEISPFKSLMISLAAKIGVGSIAGIALAIYIGGIGTIFWIWVIGIITSINSYCESYLSLKYQQKEKNNYYGGPYYYIEKGLKKKRLAKFYAALVILAYIVGFMSIQANTITISISSYINIDSKIIASILSLISLIPIIKGLKSVVNITSKLVPVIGLLYISLGLIIIIKNINLIPSLTFNIVKEAFNIKSFTSGFIPSFIIGMKRGVFSTEAGLGTGSIASATSNGDDKISLSLIQILGIYFTVFIVCTTTALIILTSNYNTLIFDNLNGIELTQYALSYHLGNIGNIILIISIILLAYSTIVAGYYYGECSLKYLTKNKFILILLKVLTIILLFIGSIINSTIIWKIVDVSICLLAITNMYSLLCLRKEIIFDYKNSK